MKYTEHSLKMISLRFILFVQSVLVHINGTPTPLGSVLDANAQPKPTEAFPYKETMDAEGKYYLFWNKNETHVTMEVHVRTHGYVGFGLSKNGNMFPADIVIGWIKDGTTYFSDRHSTGHTMPVRDKSQDWIILHGEENSFGTILKFTRKIQTCDDDDLEITEATMRAIYSYHQKDPVSEDVITYHGANRGARSIMFLSKSENIQLPDDAMTVEFLNDKFPVPSADTTYQCTVFDLKWLTQKHHLVHFEPAIEPGNEDIVHHIVVFKCPVDRKYINVTFDCYFSKDVHIDICSVAFLAWAVGGEAFYFPENIGYPVAEDGDDDLFIMQMHYNNPAMKSNYVDSSGMRFTLTKKLRPIEAGQLTVGLHVSPYYQIVPPHVPKFISTAYCPQECLNRGLADMSDGINVIAIFQHAHLIARGIRTRVVRNGVEIKPLADDRTYDFDFQDIRRINRTLLSGDSIITQCIYNSSKRSFPTYGGESTREEMCLSYLYYYPRMKVEICTSGPVFDNVPVPHSHILEYIKAYNWTDRGSREHFQTIVDNSKHRSSCGGTWGKTIRKTVPVEYPQKLYAEKQTCPGVQ